MSAASPPDLDTGFVDAVDELEAVYALAPVGLCRLDAALRVLRTNTVFDALAGCAGARLIGRTLADCGSPLWPRLAPALTRVLAGIDETVEIDLPGAGDGDGDGDGQTAGAWRMSVRRAGSAGTRLTGLLLIARDVSAKVQALARADALRSELARRVGELQAVLDLAPVPIAIARDPHCHDIVLNAACARLLRMAPGQNASLSRPDLGPLPFRIFHEGRELPPESLPMQHAAATGEDVRDLEVEMIHADGSRRTLLEAASPLRDASGRVNGCVGVFVDITDRKRNEQVLIDNDRRKDEFLAMLAHELRNPLAPISHAVRMLQRLSDSDAVRRGRATELIGRQVEHLTRLVDDLLDVSRITQGKVRLERQPIDLGPAISAGIELSRPVIEARRHRLSVTLPTAASVDGDATRLAQVVGNLLNNAAKYTEPGGYIEVWTDLRDAAGEIDLHVRDSGMGISPTLLPAIFDLFTQEHRSLDRAEGGLGIGLSLVRRLVELHGGRVRATSGGRGQGSQFTVTLPLSEQTPHLVETTGATPDARSSSLRRVLIVDDNVDSADSLGMLLELEGHTVAIAHDGLHALTLAEAFAPDAALLDIGLPGMDGHELARRLRGRPGGERTVLVALTGYGRPQDIERSRAAGFDAHLVKPFDPAQLRAVLTR